MPFLSAGSFWFLFIVEPTPCGGFGLVALQGFLVRELVSVFWRVELDPFSLECNEVSSSEFWGVYGFGMILGSLPFNAQDCVPALLQN